MIITLLCGGAGTRFNSIFPKPLNLVQGLPMIYHVINKLSNISKLTIIYNKILDDYGFPQYLINTFGHIKFDFIKIDFQTRGAAETLYIGLSKLDDSRKKEQVVVLDNDNIYEDVPFNNICDGNFIMYNKNSTGLHHYSFVEIKDEYILDIQERKPISEYICIGGYGFVSVEVCMNHCKKIILNTNDDEPYLSKVMGSILDSGDKVKAFYCPKVYSIGTPKDILLNASKISKHKLRVIFDLDNTIVTYPNIYKNYKSVSHINHIKKFIKYLRDNGNEVIIYTSRNMVTCNYNVGKVIKNVGLTTIESLQQMGIEYDELYFGKPYGDIYIDDKGFNPYDINLMEQLGFYDIDNILLTSNYKTNKYNFITRINNYQIRKCGKDLSGEIYYYNIINNNNSIQNYFPKFFTHDNQNSIILEFINGTAISKIYYEGLLQSQLIEKLLNNMRAFHKTDIDDGIIITDKDIYEHYFNKFEERSRDIKDFPFEDFNDVYNRIKDNLFIFLKRDFPINPIIHGDLWFSNMMYYKQEFYLYDMRGKFNNILTIKGHILYDYAKIYQSIIGLDSIILYNTHIDPLIREPIEKTFWEILYKHNILIHEDDKILLKNLTGYLVYNTFHFYDDDFELSKKHKIWELVKQCI